MAYTGQGFKTPGALSPPTMAQKIQSAPLGVVDTGWGWVVAMAACFCLFFVCGFSYSTGVYYVVFLETFESSKGKTAWISSLNFGILCAVGPISSVLINGISCRFSIFLGGIISTAGLLLSAFAGNINTLYLTFGILTGAGFGLVFTPCVVIISEYFSKYRVIAMGLSISGTSLGTISYPWLSRLLINIYGWRGALILTSGINSHVCVAALVMRPNRKQRKCKVIRKQEPFTVSQSSGMALGNQPGETVNCKWQTSATRHTRLESDRQCLNLAETHRKDSFNESTKIPVQKNSHKVILSVASLQNKQLQQDMSTSYDKRNIKKRKSTEFQSSGIQDSPDGILPKMSTIQWIIQHFNLIIFTKPTFLLISVNTFLFCFGMSVMYTHISAYAAAVGINVSEQDTLISAIGLTNLIGRLVLGLAAQCLPINITCLFIGSYLLAGLGITCCAISTSFTGLLFSVFAFGFFSAGFGPLLSEVTCQAVGVVKFSMAYGHLMVFMAIGTMIGAPIAGVLYDHTQFYQSSFYLGGACLILSSTIMLLDVLPSRCQSKNYASTEEHIVYVEKHRQYTPTDNSDILGDTTKCPKS